MDILWDRPPSGAASGEQLDRIGTLYGVERGVSETDADYRDRILSRVVPEAPKTVGEHLEIMAKLDRFLRTGEPTICGSCGEKISPDVMLGTRCACAPPSPSFDEFDRWYMDKVRELFGGRGDG